MENIYREKAREKSREREERQRRAREREREERERKREKERERERERERSVVGGQKQRFFVYRDVIQITSRLRQGDFGDFPTTDVLTGT
jgi:hypothetical protein